MGLIDFSIEGVRTGLYLIYDGAHFVFCQKSEQQG